MSIKHSHEKEGTLAQCLRELTMALGHHDYDLSGDQIVVRDANRRLVIHLVYEGDRKLGSLDLPMTEVQYDFIGYSEDDATALMKHLSDHMMREGG